MLIGNDESLPRTRDACRGESGEAALRSAHAWVPGRADGGERPLESGFEAAVETLDAAGLEIEAAVLGRLHCEGGVLETAQDLFPLVLRGRGVLLDERERRTRRKCLADSHSRAHARRLGRGGDGTKHGLPARSGGKRGGTTRKTRPRTKGCAELKA